MVRLRIKYGKTGPIRFASHRDTTRAFRRSFAASDVPVCYSQGFNPHPRMSFGPSLRTGWEGLGEFFDGMFEESIPDFAARCNMNLPDGLSIVETAIVGEGVPKLSADICAARYAATISPAELVPGTNPMWEKFTGRATASDPAASEPIADLSASFEAAITAGFGGETVTGDDTEGHRPLLLDVNVSQKDGGVLVEYMTTMHAGKSLTPEELLDPFFGASLELCVPIQVARTELYVRRDGAYRSPISKGVVQADK